MEVLLPKRPTESGCFSELDTYLQGRGWSSTSSTSSDGVAGVRTSLSALTRFLDTGGTRRLNMRNVCEASDPLSQALSVLGGVGRA
jgi:hypothetical protein